MTVTGHLPTLPATPRPLPRRRRTRAARLLALAAVAALAACGADDPGEPPADAAPGTGAGQALFQQLCSPCHGAEGQGTDLGYELQHPVRDYAEFVVRSGRPGLEFPNSAMPAFAEGTVPPAALDEVLDFLDSVPQPTTGDALYADYCANCHGADARGGVVNQDIRDKGIGDITEKVREGEGGSAFGDRARFMPSFAADVLSDAELTQIAEYLATLL